MARPRLLWGLLIAVAAGVIVSAGWSRLHASVPAVVSPLNADPTPALSIYGHVPDFALIDEAGRPFDAAGLRGQVWIADFIFTSCAGQCPQMTDQMRLLQQRLPKAVQFVSITVDPVRDTPTVLTRYSQTHGADPTRWHFLTGELAAIARLSKEGFRLSFAEGGSPDEPITHSVRFVLLDQGGQIRGFYDATDPEALKRLVGDAESLLRDLSR